jgi:DUF4097 and DUF4098 domain-containing protein YvlB
MTLNSIQKTLVIALSLMLSAMAGSAAAEDLSRHFHETFDVQPGARLVLEHGDGDVTVEPWSEDSLDVEIHYRAKASNIGWSKSTDFEVDFRQDGNTVFVTGHEPKRISVGISTYREYEYTYTVKAPSYVELSLQGDDGDVEVEDWTGSILIKLEDGDVNLSDIDAPRTEVILEDGDLEIDGIRGALEIECEDGDIEIYDCETEHGRIRSEDGDIVIDRCQGNFEIVVADGDARLREVTAQNLEIRSSDGTVNVSLLPSDGLDLDVRVGDGDVVLDLDRDLSANFELETEDGRIKVSAADVMGLSQERRRVTGQLGAGDGVIYVRSDDGSVTLRQ